MTGNSRWTGHPPPPSRLSSVESHVVSPRLLTVACHVSISFRLYTADICLSFPQVVDIPHPSYKVPPSSCTTSLPSTFCITKTKHNKLPVTLLSLSQLVNTFTHATTVSQARLFIRFASSWEQSTHLHLPGRAVAVDSCHRYLPCT